MDERPSSKIKKARENKGHHKKNTWPYKVLVLAIVLSFVFSIMSEFLLGNTGLIVSVIVIFIFVAVSIVTDMIGVAVTACSKEPFVAMASKKVKGAKEALMLIKNADKVSSLCADVIGDICGILSGAAGASIVAKIAVDFQSVTLTMVVASLIASLIAGITIFGKAVGKRVGIDKSKSIILKVGRFVGIFVKDKKQKIKNSSEKVK